MVNTFVAGAFIVGARPTAPSYTRISEPTATRVVPPRHKALSPADVSPSFPFLLLFKRDSFWNFLLIPPAFPSSLLHPKNIRDKNQDSYLVPGLKSPLRCRCRRHGFFKCNGWMKWILSVWLQLVASALGWRIKKCGGGRGGWEEWLPPQRACASEGKLKTYRQYCNMATVSAE